MKEKIQEQQKRASIELKPENLYAQKYFYVFLVTNQKKTLLQSGLTGSLQVQITQWEREYTTENPEQCIFLLYWEQFSDVTKALLREKELNKMSDKKKRWLIATSNPGWQTLNHEENFLINRYKITTRE